MRALVVDHSAEAHLTFAEVPDPDPASNEAVIKVEAISLNSGEIKRSTLPATPDGSVLGYDAAGVVVRAASDGSGPAVGARVITLGAKGAWAQFRTVPTHSIGTVPEGADLGAVSTIPVAGTTALLTLRRLGQTLGRRVLITGASGGFGRYAVQLAARSGAEVVAITGDPAQADGLRALGAHEVLPDPAKVDQPVFGVLDGVGGPQMVAAFGAMHAGGKLISIGHAAMAESNFEYGAFLSIDGRHDRSIQIFNVIAEAATGVSRELTWLAAETAAGRLDPQITWRTDWSKYAEAIGALVSRRLHGKAVLDVS